MTVAGLIFSNIHDNEMSEFTGMRTVASVPFGCRYRLIDFPLSYMVNASISKIGVITHNNYRSLVDHIGTNGQGLGSCAAVGRNKDTSALYHSLWRRRAEDTL